MAARRIGKSSIDWASFAQKVPPSQKQMYFAFKSRSDGYLSRVLSLPENAPKINFDYYRKQIPHPTLVEQFEKEYNALKIPYPTTTAIQEVDTQEKDSEKAIADFIKASEQNIVTLMAELEKWKNLIPFEHMTLEDYRDAFPEYAIDTFNRPTFWPHTPDEQPGYEDDQAHKGGH